MLTETTIKGIGRFFRICYHLKLLPYIWTDTASLYGLTLSSSRLHINLWKFSITIQLCQSLFQVYVSILNFYSKTISVPHKIMDFGWMYMNINTTILHVIIFSKKQEIAQCLTQCFNIHLHDGPLKTKKSTLDKMSEILVTRCEIPIFVSSFLMTMTFVIDPEKLRFVYFHLPQCFKSKFLVPFFACYEFYLLLCSHMLLVFCVIVIITYTALAHASIRKLSFNTRWLGVQGMTAYKRFPKLMTIVREFQALKILNTDYNYTFCSEFIPNFLVSLLTIHVVIIYVLVKLHMEMPYTSLLPCLFWAIGILFGELVIVLKMGQVKDLSKDFIHLVDCQVERKDRRQAAYLTPIGFKMNGIIKKKTALVTVLVVCKITKYALLIK